MKEPEDEPDSSSSLAARLGVEEATLQNRSKWMIRSGAAVNVVLFAMAGIWHAGFHYPMPITYIMPLYAVAFGAILIGCLEYLNRQTRHRQMDAIARLERLEASQSALLSLLPEVMQQRYYAGYSDGLKDAPGLRTGTDDQSLIRGTGEVLKLQRREDRQR